jgi:Ca2+-binding EF-hand superfamily protein
MDLDATLKCVDLYTPKACRAKAEDDIKQSFGILDGNGDGKICGNDD